MRQEVSPEELEDALVHHGRLLEVQEVAGIVDELDVHVGGGHRGGGFGDLAADASVVAALQVEVWLGGPTLRGRLDLPGIVRSQLPKLTSSILQQLTKHGL